MRPMPSAVSRPDPIGVRSLADLVHDRIRDRIVSGDLPGGEPIRQDALASAFGISKIPLREALTRLERDGLVVSAPNRGFFVSPPTEAEAEEVFALRLLVEPQAVVAGSLHATRADHETAELQIRALEAAILSGTPDPGLSNRLFHLALVRPGAGRLTCSIVERLHTVSDRYVRLHLGRSGRDHRANAEHRAMLRAWIASDTERLAVLVRTHLADTLADLRHELSAGAAVPT